MSHHFVTMSRPFSLRRQSVIPLYILLSPVRVYKPKKESKIVYTRWPCGKIVTTVRKEKLSRSKINRGRARREELRESAIERATARAQRSNSEQIELLNARLGKDCGAVRERRKLMEDAERENTKNPNSPKSSGSTRQQRKAAKAARHRQRREEDVSRG